MAKILEYVLTLLVMSAILLNADYSSAVGIVTAVAAWSTIGLSTFLTVIMRKHNGA